jgi:glycosyltransferase involved in cell wall biosynthesis
MTTVSESTSPFLQIGAMYNLPRAVGHRVPCFSYHDGNIVEALRSGYGFNGIPARRVDEAIQYEREVAQEMTTVFTFSEYLRKSFIADFGLDEKRVFNVGGGVNIENLPEAPSNKNYEKQEILFVGVDFDRKGGKELLSAFRIVREHLPSARLHIVGPHRIPLGADQPGVMFHGNLNKSIPAQRDELYRLYQSSSIFVLPSKYEPFGVAPLEAMLFQLPCIVTNGWALREFVVPGMNGALVEKESVESLVTALIELLKSPDQLARMGQRGREIVLENYLWPKVVAKMSTAANLN